ncbi:hypothetical protein [Nostoc sp.]
MPSCCRFDGATDRLVSGCAYADFVHHRSVNQPCFLPVDETSAG